MKEVTNITPISTAQAPANLARMRTAVQLHEELLKIDPNTGISRSYVRRIVAAGVLPYHCVGNRRLVNLDIFLAYLAGDYDPTGWEREKAINGDPKKVTY